jgi:Flp pilus assembly protein TadD
MGALRIHPKLIFTITVLLTGCMVGAVYLPGLPGDFMFDDFSSISGNADILVTQLNTAALMHAMLSAPLGGFLRPLSMLSFILDAHFFGLAPGAFKLTNILLHLATGAVLWCVAREILRALNGTGHLEPQECAIAWLSLAATAIWLVHPLNLTAVLYVVQRETILAAFFTAAAIWSYLAGRRRQRAGGDGRVLIWCITPLMTLLGMLCKESAALVPFYLLIIEFVLLNFEGKEGRSREIQWFFAIFLLMPVAAVCALLAIRPGFLLAAYVNRDFTMYERLLSECRILMDYLRWTLLPDLRQLALFHDDIGPSRGLLRPPTTLVCLLALSALFGAALWLRRRAPLISLGILWFFAGHLLESTFLPLELTFEHRNYLPIFGLILGCVASFHTAAQKFGYKHGTTILVIVTTLLFASVTAVRAMDWHNELSFAQSEATHHPDSPRAQYELAWAYMSIILASKDTTLVPRAVQAARRSKTLDPGSINQDVGLGYMYAELGDKTNAKAYIATAAEDAKHALPSSTLQLALQTLLTMARPDNASLFGTMDTLLLNSTTNPDLQRNACYAANIWNTYGLFQQKTGDFLDALGTMHKAVQLCPGEAKIRINFANMLLTYGDTKDAREQIDMLNNLHDIRNAVDIYALEQQWARQVAQKNEK